jgi:hypothetical protein
MENFDYYPDEDFDFDPTFELQNQASGSSDTPHETSTIRKLSGTQTHWSKNDLSYIYPTYILHISVPDMCSII